METLRNKGGPKVEYSSMIQKCVAPIFKDDLYFATVDEGPARLNHNQIRIAHIHAKR